MAESLYVHVDFGGGRVALAGQFLFNPGAAKPKDQGGRFMYSPTYIDHPDAYAIDPINLPLVEGRVYFAALTRSAPGVFGVFGDSGADSWGRALMRLLMQPAPSTPVECLLAGSGMGCGALRFSTGKTLLENQGVAVGVDALDVVQEAAGKIAVGETVDDAAMNLFRGSVGVGGMRPKALVDMDGSSWIAKFDRPDDPYSYAIAEHVCMTMAAEAGCDVATTKLVSADRHSICCVERFDRVGNNQHHIISIGSLTNSFDITQYDARQVSYPGIVQIVKQLGEGGEDAAEQMYRRMLINVAIGNTDDHVRNHALILRAGAAGYRLTPAYDVVPNHRMIGSQAIAVGDFGNTANGDNLRSAAKRMGIGEAAARQAASDVFNIVRRWKDRMLEHGMDKAGCEQIGRSMVRLDVIERFSNKDW